MSQRAFQKNIQSSRHPGIQTNPPFHRRVQKANPRKQCLRPTKKDECPPIQQSHGENHPNSKKVNTLQMPPGCLLFMALYMPESFSEHQ